MSCEAFEKLIALNVEGDLPPAETAGVQAHLETCARCRELDRSIRESQAALKTLAQADGPDEQALAAWRRGVLRRIEEQPRRLTLGWRWAWAAPAAAMALLVVLWLNQGKVGSGVGQAVSPAAPAPSSVGQAVSPALAKPAGLEVGQAVSPARTIPTPPSHRHRTPAPSPPTEPLLVKLETPDPNVVIYWIVDRKGN